VFLFRACGAHSIHRAPARLYPNKIISQVVQLLFDLSLSSFAYATTQITAAIPMVMPSTVSTLRILFRSNATSAD